VTDRDRVSTLLIEECGDTLPLSSLSNPASLERIRFAVLKVSGGHLNRLRQAIDLARSIGATCSSLPASAAISPRHRRSRLRVVASAAR
jgi:hypothetical protein